MPMQIFGEVKEVYYGICASSECYTTGDFNLNLLDSDLHSVTNDFINVLFSHALFPLIVRPTRITCTSHTVTLTDNIFTNNISVCCKNGLIINDLSDHLPIMSLCFLIDQVPRECY